MVLVPALPNPLPKVQLGFFFEPTKVFDNGQSFIDHKNKVMENCSFTIGVDVSKLTLDIYCSQVGQHTKVPNGAEGFRAFRKWCGLYRIDLKSSLVVMEHTGGYEYRFAQSLESSSIRYCRVPGLAIKNSLGITRGKSDRVDSVRIAGYAEEKIKKLEPSKPLDTNVLKLRQLLSFRKRLVRENAGLLASAKERRHMYEPPDGDLILAMCGRRTAQNMADIKLVEAELMAIIGSDGKMQANYDIVTSIKGIGMVNGLMAIAYTENFTSFGSARAYAVFAGVVPFDHSSGTSINGRKRVSHLANKELKQELNQAARTAIVHDPELRAYAAKKMLTKPYRVVLNNVKFKLVLRMFSLVRRGEKHVDNYKKAA